MDLHQKLTAILNHFIIFRVLYEVVQQKNFRLLINGHYEDEVVKAETVLIIHHFQENSDF